MPSAPTQTLAPGTELHGFRIDAVTELPNLGATAYLAEHAATGARFLHLHAEDRENLFAIATRTPPEDDSGIAHILEHTVLCGSQRYPVKDPFVELLKSSLASFLNAMTYPDRTVYPCASMNREDFFNLASVYCDAVYHPLIREDHFKQEGHRLGFEPTGDTDGKLVIKGIVYNEMKGAYSDFNGTWFRATKTGICPDNTYGCDSGGRPDAIPTLTYDAFCEFHRTLYHPSNSYIFCYGDIATEDHLAFLAERLAAFERIEVDTAIAEQPRWTEPVRREVPYPVGSDEDLAAKTAVTMTWLCCPVTDTERWLALQALSGYLFDNDASPLRRALIASGLGKGLAPSGYMDSMRDTVMTVGLKGTEAARAGEVEQLIRDCLAQQADTLDRGLLDAAFHQLELEVADVPGMYPLRLMGRAYQRWCYGADPLEAIDVMPHLQRLRARDDAFFQGLIREYLVDNAHCLIQTFVPDREHNARAERDERARIDAIGAGLDAGAKAAIAADDARMEAAQAEPNSPEALATLPRLALADVPRENEEPVVHQQAVGDATVLRTELVAPGVSHLALAFDLSGLDDALIDLLPLFGTALTRLGAGGSGWEALARRQDEVMSGVSAATHLARLDDDPLRTRFLLQVGTSALHREVPAALDIIRDRVLALDLGETDRLKELIGERAVQLRNGVIPGGSSYATAYAARHLGRSEAIAERKGGFTQIRSFEALAKDLDAGFDRILAGLEAIREHLATRAPLVASVVGDDTATTAVESFARSFAERGGWTAIDDAPQPVASCYEGVATAADVAYVARVGRVGPQDDARAAALGLLANQLRVGFLWERIRVRGGAYGARTSYHRLSGTFACSSYRDPHIAQTLATYGEIADHIADGMELDDGALDQAIIGTIKTIDRPLRPGQAAGQSLVRHLRRSSAEQRQRDREALLGLTPAVVRAVATEALGPALAEGPVCVLSSREKLEAANAKLDQPLEISEL